MAEGSADDGASHDDTILKREEPAAVPTADTLLGSAAPIRTDPELGRLQVPRGTSIGRFVVTDELGRGAMGIVLAAFDPELERQVAIKLLSRELSGGASSLERQRFLQEARAMAQLSHPNVVAVHEVGTWQDRIYLVMEFIHGVTLRRWLEDERTTSEIVEAFTGAGRGLAAAHQAGIVHRDFKPDNVLVGEHGRVRVTDFGLAGSSSRPSTGASVSESGGRSFDAVAVTLTGTGTLMGTPAYMSPEQYAEQPLDGRSDQFAYCIALYEALHGQRPFTAQSLAELAANVRTGRRSAPPAGASVPARLRKILDRGLQVDPEQRYDTMEALLADLVRTTWWRRRETALAGMALLAGSGVAAVSLSAEDPCARGDEPMLQAWSTAQRDAVREAFEASGRPHAARTWQTVEETLTGYVERWTSMRREACVAAHVDRTQSADLFDRRMSCLQRRLESLSALAAGLAQADGAAVDKAVRAAGGLPEIDDCGDVQALTAAVARPEDPAVAQRVDALQPQLAAIATQYELGQYDEASQALEPVVREARELGYPPLLAEAGHLAGRLAYRRSDYEASEQALREALAAAARGRLAQREAELSSTLVYVVGVLRSRYDEGIGLAEVTRSAILRAGEPPLLEGQLQSNLALVLGEAGRYEEAVKLAEQSVKTTASAVEPESLRLASVLTNLGKLQDEAGRPEDAVQTLQRALAVKRSALGDDHPELLTTLEALGNAQLELDPQKARDTYDEILPLAQKNYGNDHAGMASIYTNLGNVERALHRLDAARDAHEQAVQIFERVFGKDHPNVAQAMVNLANTVGDQGHVQEAKALYERALEIGEAAWGPDHPHVAIVLDNLGGARLAEGDYRGALADLTRALQIRLSLPAGHPDIPKALFNVASLERATGDHDSAKDHFEQAGRLYAERFGAEHPEVASVHEQLGMLFEEQEGYEDAVREYETALRMYERAPKDNALAIASVLGNLGDAQRERGDVDQALKRYERSIEIRTEHLGPDHPQLAYPIQSRGEALMAKGDVVAARQDFERAVQLRTAHEVDPNMRAYSQFWLARALGRLRVDPQRADDLARTARETFARGGDIGAPNVEEIDAWLAARQAAKR